MATGPVKGIYGGSTHTLWIIWCNFNYDGSTKWTRMIQQLLMQNATAHFLHGRLGSLLPSLWASVLRQSAASSHSRSGVHSDSSLSTGPEGWSCTSTRNQGWSGGTAKRVSGAWLWRSRLPSGAQVPGPGALGPWLGEDSRDRTESIALDRFSVTLWLKQLGCRHPVLQGLSPAWSSVPTGRIFLSTGKLGSQLRVLFTW